MSSGFNYAELGEIAELYDSLHQTPQYSNEGYPMIRVTDIRRGYLDTTNAVKVDEATYVGFSKKYKPKVGDLLFSRVGSYGNSTYVDRQEEFCLGQNTACISPDRLRIEPFFLYCVLNSNELRHQIESLVGGASQGTISLKSIRKLHVPLPPLPVQRRIAGILSAYDELIENSRRRIKILEAMARALYREWFVHFRFPGHENHPRIASPLGEIPTGWEVRNVKDIASVTYGFPFASAKFNTSGSGTPIIRIRDIPQGFTSTFTEEDADAKYHIRNGHILVGMDGDFHMCIWSAGHAVQNQRVARFETNGEIGNHHLFLALEQPIQAFNKAIVGTTVAHLGDMHIKTIQIVWPPATLRDQAREVLEPMSEQVIALKRQVQNLRRTRDLLLPRLLSGQIAVEAA